MIAYLFTAIFLSLVWAVVLALDLPLAIAIAPTAAVLASVGGLFAFRKLKAHQAARELEKALAGQAQAHVSGARPDQQADIEAMQAEFNKAVASLKSSKLSRGGTDALSVLPWYVIIGPPGAGKSTALRNSGLQFPYLSARGGGVRGVGGTRNCEWWLTNEAVILDTAGRYTTGDEDRDEWFSFLDTLARHRAKKPVNGLIVAVSVGEVLEADEETAAQLGQKLRERVDEVMSRLKIIVPVYVLFTKCDLISGFVETFGGLHKAERSQIWGYTAMLGAGGPTPGEQFQQRFDELVSVLEKRALQRLGQERRQQTREKVYQFPLQFGSLRQSLTDLLQNLFVENIYQDTPLLRGVYFTSGTQEGRPIDRLMNVVAAGFGIRPTAGSAVEPVLDAKSYFLGEVFSQVMFRDQDLSVRNVKETRRQGMLRYLYAGGSLALAVLLLLFPTVSFFKNRELVQSTEAMVAAVKFEQAPPGSAAWFKTLAPLRMRVSELLGYEKDGPPFSMRLGMYQGNALLAPLKLFYGAALHRTLVGPVFTRDEERMDAFARAQETADTTTVKKEHVRQYDRLKLHLLLSGPRGEAEPTPADAQRDWVATEVVDGWAQVFEQEPSPEERAELEAQARLFAQLTSDPAVLMPRSEPLVRRMREALGRLPWENLALEKLVTELSEQRPDLTLRSVLGGTAPFLKSAGKVRSAFTRKAWDELLRSRLAGPAQDSEGWVLASTGKSSEAAEKEARQLKAAYFQAYVVEWRRFLESIRVEPPTNNAEALTMLEDLTRGKTPPFARLFQLVGSNVRLGAGDPLMGLKGATAEKVRSGIDALQAKGKELIAQAKGLGLKGSSAGSGEEGAITAADVEQSFAGFTRFGVAPPKDAEAEGGPQALPLDVYQEQLEFLRDALRADLESPDDHGPLLTKLQSARIRVKSLIDAQDVGWRPRIEALLWPALEGSTRSSANEAAATATQRFCSSVVAPFDQSLAKLYPFNPTSVHDAGLNDVADFYRPEQGTLWGYYNASLKNDVLFDGSKYRWSGRFGAASKAVYNESLLRFLEHSRETTASLFPKGSPEITTAFNVLIHPAPKVASITFTVNGRSIEYKNGPETQQGFVWPGEGKEKGARLVVRTNKGEKEEYVGPGEWGLFHLLEQAALEPPSSGSRAFTAKWKMRSLGTDVSIVFEPSRDAPFFGASSGGKAEFLRPFRGANVKPPRMVGRSGSGCDGEG